MQKIRFYVICVIRTVVTKKDLTFKDKIYDRATLAVWAQPELGGINYHNLWCDHHRMSLGDVFLSASTYSPSSRVLRTAGSFFFRPGGGAILVAVSVFLEEVWKTGAFEELKKKQEYFFTDSSL